MGFAQGVAAGRAAGTYWDPEINAGGNPYAIVPSLNTPLQYGQPQKLPQRATGIRNYAAELALKERALDLKERQQAFLEQKAAQEQALARQKQSMGYEAYRRKAALAEEKQWTTEDQAARQNDFNMARAGLAMNNPQPIISYFNTYGNPNANIDNIEFGPDGKDMLVHFSGQKKPVYFKSKDEFYKGLMAFADPRVEAAMINSASRKEVAKISATNKKTANPYKVTVAQASNEYDKRFKDMNGEYTPKAPDREKWINDYIAKHEAMGQGQAAKKRKGPVITKEMEAADGSGNTLRIWSDGTKEVIEPNGNVPYIQSPQGIKYKKDSFGYNKYLKTKEPIGETKKSTKQALPRKKPVATTVNKKGDIVEIGTERVRTGRRNEIQKRFTHRVVEENPRNKKKKKKKHY